MIKFEYLMYNNPVSYSLLDESLLSTLSPQYKEMAYYGRLD